ncbi:hypothetical protein COCMIDRAFT_107598 [Bipolaris oryzae ATCC 44560]|uniref:Uncharacterized protein n=1 Tax=Bipolaris oryzae ATCC 44560 TaxID=930090 RepID=W6YNI1_COCMI|nr:uncharacterized protein COCMIDRAFT_107598 [Bipolaris oryzae ATCC 44560]EUC40907.1 hypothetical protein COCMIDRAFT_107598 [Bipolaris oryzae ATCC 44560]
MLPPLTTSPSSISLDRPIATGPRNQRHVKLCTRGSCLLRHLLPRSLSTYRLPSLRDYDSHTYDRRRMLILAFTCGCYLFHHRSGTRVYISSQRSAVWSLGSSSPEYSFSSNPPPRHGSYTELVATPA